MAVLRTLFFTALLSLVLVESLSASEIRIQDARGLIRFSSPTDTPRTLLVLLSAREGVKEVRLEQEDGFRSPLLGRRLESGEFVLQDVPPGRYRIYVDPGSVSVTKVSLQK